MELTRHTVLVCESNVDWGAAIPSSSGGRSYIVRYSRLPFEEMQRQSSQYGYTCTCPGFKFRGACRHVDKAKALRCGWNSEMEICDAGDKNGERCCPDCGGDVVPFQVGV